MSLTAAKKRPPTPFAPVRVLDVELAGPLPDLAATPSPDGVRYGSAHVLVMLHGDPLGVVIADLAEPVPAASLAALVSAELGDAVADHLRADGLPAGRAVPAEGFGAAGVKADEVPACRRPFLAPADAASTPLVTVVIATCKRPDLIVTCVRSILAGDYRALEVVVVDNCPAEQATAKAVDAEFGDDPRVRYLAEPVPGASRARNRGIAAARGEIIAITDDDVIAEPGWIAALAGSLAIQPDVVCVSGLTHPLELETAAQLWFEQYGGFARRHERRVFHAHEPAPPTRLYPYTAGVFGSGNNVAIRAEALRTSGGFDTRLGPGTVTHGGEDLDLFLRLLLAGGNIAYEPRALVRHLHRRDDARLHHQVFTYGAGATAMLTKWWLRDATLRRKLVGAVAGALPAAFGPRTPPADSAWPASPPSLARAQLSGNLAGPVLWARSAIRRRED